MQIKKIDASSLLARVDDKFMDGNTFDDAYELTWTEGDIRLAYYIHKEVEEGCLGAVIRQDKDGRWLSADGQHDTETQQIMRFLARVHHNQDNSTWLDTQL